MINLICEAAKYLSLLFMILYTVKCFVIMSSKNQEDSSSNLNKQIVYVFLIHFFNFLILYLRLGQIKILVFYGVQIFVAIFYMIVFHSIYKESSRLLTNNMAFLLLIGYIILTRLNFSLAMKQFLFATIGLFITSFIPLIIVKWKKLKDMGTVYGIVGIIFLITVFIPGLGFSNYGSRNWIRIGSLSLQPMEFVKILFVFFVASMLVKANTFKDLFVNALISAGFMGVLVLEKDLGAAVIFYITYVFLVYVATSRSVFLVGGISLGVAAVCGAYMLFKDSLFAHVMVRVEAWRDPFAHIDTGGYQVSQSLFAIGTGGYAGSGLTLGKASSIPVSESDFIFSAICEEMGVIFGLCLILVIVSIFISFANVAMKCRRPFYKYVAFGFATIYIIQSLLNLGGVTKFIPSTGVTLPLISYGVSSVMSTLIIFAIVQGVSIINNKEAARHEKEKARTSALAVERGGRIPAQRKREGKKQ
ncbi:MAG: FtsW/RodA/SpoVE family cell cycle protein [Clostridium sp.]|nr:FtsW/RodA/SpoVE family cell cycle protein [Clostridium sp.]MCM1458593.1 FtsW/RodA/SpoVE family cell cycle protein [Bacteroides sp.]